MQSIKTSWLALSLVAIASTTGGWFAISSRADSNQNQAPNAERQDAGSMRGMMRHDSSMMNHSMAIDLGPADANYDLRFIDAMTIHHQGAVEMAEAAQQKSQRPEIKKLTENIIADQTQEIAQMRQWRQAWYPKVGEQAMAYNAQMGHMMEMSSDQMQGMMMGGDLGAADAEFDLHFLKAMIAHHEGALIMAQDALSKSQRPEIKELASEIVKSQMAEIAQMKQWQQS